MTTAREKSSPAEVVEQMPALAEDSAAPDRSPFD